MLPGYCSSNADVNARIYDGTCTGQTLLHLVVRYNLNRNEVVHMLLEHRANVAAEDNQYRTALHVESDLDHDNGTVEVVRRTRPSYNNIIE